MSAIMNNDVISCEWLFISKPSLIKNYGNLKLMFVYYGNFRSSTFKHDKYIKSFNKYTWMNQYCHKILDMSGPSWRACPTQLLWNKFGDRLLLVGPRRWRLVTLLTWGHTVTQRSHWLQIPEMCNQLAPRQLRYHFWRSFVKTSNSWDRGRFKKKKKVWNLPTSPLLLKETASQ